MRPRLLAHFRTMACLTVMVVAMLPCSTWGQMTAEQAQKLLEQQSHHPTKPSSTTPPHAPALPEVMRELRVGSWNIEWLGTPGNRSYQAAGHAQSAKTITRYLTLAKLDVLCVQEVKGQPTGQNGDLASPILAQALAAMPHGQWKHILFPAHGRSGNQLTGIAWNAEKVTPVGPPKQIHPQFGQRDAQGNPIRLYSAGPRPPHGLRFSCGEGLTDLVIVPIHWKSGGGKKNLKRRRAEAAELVAGLPKTFDDPDVLILGDSNTFKHRSPAMTDMSKGGFVDLNTHDIPTHVGRMALDRAFVPADQPEFKKTHFRVVPMPSYNADRFKKELSDHYLIAVTVTVMEDDD